MSSAASRCTSAWREVAVGLREPGEVEARRGDRPGVARLLGGGERGLVRLARLLRAPAALVRDGERAERDRLDACIIACAARRRPPLRAPRARASPRRGTRARRRAPRARRPRARRAALLRAASAASSASLAACAKSPARTYVRARAVSHARWCGAAPSAIARDGVERLRRARAHRRARAGSSRARSRSRPSRRRRSAARACRASPRRGRSARCRARGGARVSPRRASVRTAERSGPTDASRISSISSTDVTARPPSRFTNERSGPGRRCTRSSEVTREAIGQRRDRALHELAPTRRRAAAPRTRRRPCVASAATASSSPTATMRAPRSDRALRARRARRRRAPPRSSTTIDEAGDRRVDAAPRAELELDDLARRHRARAPASRRLDVRDGRAADAERPREPCGSSVVRPLRRGPTTASAAPGPSTRDLGGEALRGAVDAEHRPRRGLVERAGLELRGALQRARELVDARIARLRALFGRALRDLRERVARRVVELARRVP